MGTHKRPENGRGERVALCAHPARTEQNTATCKSVQYAYRLYGERNASTPVQEEVMLELHANPVLACKAVPRYKSYFNEIL
jgi:hypothetical protein